jgi:hypothetical protein
MTLIFDAKHAGPQTHAFIVGVGAYSHLSGGPEQSSEPNNGFWWTRLGQLDSPPKSAEIITNWLLTSFTNPSAPLGTVDLLVSQSEMPFVYWPQGGARELPIDPPIKQMVDSATMQIVNSAAIEWFKRANNNPGNIALFYFCGYALFRGDEQILMLSDLNLSPAEGPSRGFFDFSQFLNSMRSCAAERQIYFVDASVVHFPDWTGMAPQILPVRAETSGRATKRAVLLAASQGYSASERHGEPSLFSQGLLASLDNPEVALVDNYINTANLPRELERHLLSEGPTVNFRLEGGGFDFHYPYLIRKPDPQPSPPSLTQFDTQFVADDAEVDHDELGRGAIAIALGRRLQRIWCTLNGATASDSSLIRTQPVAIERPIDSAAWTGNANRDENHLLRQRRDDTRAAFVIHLDAPWGGGKTTFANFLARVMNPYGYDQGDASFLRQRYGDAKTKNLGAIFLRDPPSESGSPDPNDWPEDARRPWIIVPFNAWQVEHVSPPWWVFYQAIRKGCFASIFYEGSRAVDPNAAEPPRKPSFENRLGEWLALWSSELWWRLRNPKVKTMLITALFSASILCLLNYLEIVHVSSNSNKSAGKTNEQQSVVKANQQQNVVKTIEPKNLGKTDEGQGVDRPKNEAKVGFNLSDGIGLILAGVTTITVIWGVGAILTESIVPGTDTLAERLSLGNGDPFERFRKHFYRTMERVKRPVMVIIDDLDRCKPEFIVDLVRGIQTLLRSPRVVFIILGDRDWIERAFEAQHKTMKDVSVGPEQSFGARFVEKAIQMSLILPDVRERDRVDYVRWVLLGRHARRRQTPAAGIKPETAAMLREVFQKSAEAQTGNPFETEQIRQDVMSAYKRLAPDLPGTNEQVGTEQIRQFINDELAIRAAVDQEVEREISHRLEPLAKYFPPNPRQIKRIINAVTIYHAIALQQAESEATDDRWFQLALWVILMTEWPESWRLLASYPQLTDVLNTIDPEQEVEKLRECDLPASKAAILKEINRIRADRTLMALIAGWWGRAGPVLNSTAINELLTLTPVHGRSVRLKQESAEKAQAGQAT